MDDSVVIVVESKNYLVSKQKLIERSSYFNSMFNGDFLEKNESTVNIKGIKSDSWEEILYFLHYGSMKPKICSTLLYKELLNLLQASNMLQFLDIREKCMGSLVEILDPQNCLEILEVACRLDLEVLIRRATAVALWHSDIVTTTDAFYNLTADQVEGYLGEPGLHSSNGEWGVWEAVDRWINSETDFKTRYKFIPQLIKCVSLKHLSLSHLKTISLNDAVLSCEIVSAAIKCICEDKSDEVTKDPTEEKDNDSSKKNRAPEVVEFIESWRAMPVRRLPIVPAIIAKITQIYDIPRLCIIRYSLYENEFIPFLQLDEAKETSVNTLVGFKIVANGSKLYMLGGASMTRQVSWYLAVWQYDQILGQWMFLANLLKAIRHASVCVLGDDLYVLGGFGRHRLIQETVSKLSITNRKWTVCAPLPRPMYSVPCCVFKGKIYVIQTEVYQYSPERDMWTVLNVALPQGEIVCNALANEEYIFISGLRKHVYKFDPSVPNIKFEEVGKFQWECYQACLIDEYIYSLTQRDFSVIYNCERLDIRTGECIELWAGILGNCLQTFYPHHRHGCFPLLLY